MFKLLHKFRPARILGLVAVGLALHAAPAAADVFDAGNLPVASPYVQVVSHYGSFVDLFSFNLGVESDLAASVSSLELDLGPYSVLNIDSLYLGLFSWADPATLLTFGTSEISVSGLDAGNYFVGVIGDANGIFGGSYLFGLSALPVPEPEQWMLFVAGLAALGGIARRRSR